MTARKKKGLGLMISGGIAIAVGAIVIATTSTPDWLPVVLNVIGLIGNALGFKLVFPDHE